MISGREALHGIFKRVKILPKEAVKTEDAIDAIIADNVCCERNLPFFNNSAVDGYAVRTFDLTTASLTEAAELKVAGTILAGVFGEVTFENKTTYRVMTGAPVPDFFNAVVMKENVYEKDGRACFKNTPLVGQNIRFAGEDVLLGETIAKSGNIVTPQKLGLFLSLGISYVKIFSRVKISIITTGSELKETGKNVLDGEIYGSNLQMIKALASKTGARVLECNQVVDDFNLIENETKRALCVSDIVVVIGGMSVGAHDLSKGVFNTLGVQTVFFKGKWRPGKPFYFGAIGNKFVFGLPGNPVAAFVIFSFFIAPVIRFAMGFSNENIIKKARISCSYEKKANMLSIAWATFCSNSDSLFVLEKQSSHFLGSLSKANALCLFNQGRGFLKKGDEVEYIRI